MSGIVGIVQLDGAPVEDHVLMALNDAAFHRGPDGAGCLITGSVGMAYRHFETGNSNVCSNQPTGIGHCQIVLDGRIDNGTDIRSALNIPLRADQSATDTELVIRAYEKWGTACVDRMVGEFAFGLWDAKARMLFCARDALGVKPLHYYFGSTIFIFASEIRQLLEHPKVSAELNEGMLGEYISSRVTSRSETLYRNIFRLPGGHVLSIGGSGFNVRQYWNFRCDAVATPRSDADYADEFLEVFSKAVQCRMGDGCRIGFDLSGGLDSSSNVCVASHVAEGSNRIEAFGLVLPDTRGDESVYINEVARFTGIKTNLITPALAEVSQIQQMISMCRDIPGTPNLLMHAPMLQAYQQSDIRVRLMGQGGDQLTMGDLQHTADLLRRLKFKSAFRQVHFDARVLSDFGDQASSLELFARYGVIPMLPHRIRRLAKRLLRRDRLPIWIESQFAQRTGLADRVASDGSNGATNPTFPTIVQRELWKTANSGWGGLVLEWCDRFNFSFGVENRHPYYDRRLVEFCLMLPEEQRWRRDETRFIVRGALKGFLPEAVRTRRTKGDFTGQLIRSLLRSEVRQVFESSLLASRGYLNQASLSRMYEQFKYDSGHGVAFPRFESHLEMLYGVELWLRGVFG